MTANDDQNAKNSRIRQARQVLAGDAVRPNPDPWQVGGDALPLSSLQRNYLVILGVVLLIGVALAYFTGLGFASIALFVLALGLIAAWLIF